MKDANLRSIDKFLAVSFQGLAGKLSMLILGLELLSYFSGIAPSIGRLIRFVFFLFPSF